MTGAEDKTSVANYKIKKINKKADLALLITKQLLTVSILISYIVGTDKNAMSGIIFFSYLKTINSFYYLVIAINCLLSWS